MAAKLFAIPAFLTIALSFVPTASAEVPTTQASNPFTGYWAWGFDFTPGLVVAASAKLVQDGDKLTGTTEIGGHSGTLKVTHGKVEGNKIAFEVTDDRGDLTITWKFTGVLADGKIRGKVQGLSAYRGGKPEKIEQDWTAETGQGSQPETK